MTFFSLGKYAGAALRRLWTFCEKDVSECPTKGIPAGVNAVILFAAMWAR